jgi:SAM-dependent methyltransferase
MKIIAEDSSLRKRLDEDSVLRSVKYAELASHYEEISARFHSLMSRGADAQHENALFHRIRYLELLSRRWFGRVLDVGNDKPFLSYFLRRFNPDTHFETISNEIPETPYALHEVDIEFERFPFPTGVFDAVIFTEVIEHLWRDPSHCVLEIARTLKLGGSVYVTTPNPCDRHSLVCVLWQANPNQRSAYYATLESGHLHLWTVAQVASILEAHGFEVTTRTTKDLYGHTKPDASIEQFIAAVSPYANLMHETVVVEGMKRVVVDEPRYPRDIFPDGRPVQFDGAIVGFSAHGRASSAAPAPLLETSLVSS